ncbi:hypothetical protein GCM10025860_13960 [Methanobacterium ferruginis]|nr:hypothetical protein [Methanobacterium ferruginis]BDZ67948.1 hypothetical protein GCM10025860_13960 [Methanobacterium ferruginis]
MVPKPSEYLEFNNTPEQDGKKKIVDKIRDLHHIRSYTFIKNDDSLDLDRQEKSIIADISRSHRKIDIHEELEEEYRISSSREVRLQFLGACLRIADECDITKYRISKHQLEESRSLLSFLPHFKKHELVDDIYLSRDNNKIIMRGK